MSALGAPGGGGEFDAVLGEAGRSCRGEPWFRFPGDQAIRDHGVRDGQAEGAREVVAAQSGAGQGPGPAGGAQ